MELTNRDLDLLQDIFDEVLDKIRHGFASDMGWDAGDVEDFDDLVSRHHAAAKAAGFWWARH
jgi:hypothetical protein